MPAKNGEKTLRETAMEKLNGDSGNPSMLGDPVSLKAETADSEPTDQDRGAASAKGKDPNGQKPGQTHQGGSSDVKGKIGEVLEENKVRLANPGSEHSVLSTKSKI
jgi:hypothetical protein